MAFGRCRYPTVSHHHHCYKSVSSAFIMMAKFEAAAFMRLFREPLEDKNGSTAIAMEMKHDIFSKKDAETFV
jgi:hypothetical protein